MVDEQITPSLDAAGEVTSIEIHGRVLDPVDRARDVLFGLIMVLTFTVSLNVAEAGRSDVRAMLIGALGCNFACGIIAFIFAVFGNRGILRPPIPPPVLLLI
jgi:hypothetical protein